MTVPAGPWTVDDLDDFPEGSTTRDELVDGALLVSAEPSLHHQRVNLQMARLLQDHAPPEPIGLPDEQKGDDGAGVDGGDHPGLPLGAQAHFIAEVRQDLREGEEVVPLKEGGDAEED